MVASFTHLCEFPYTNLEVPGLGQIGYEMILLQLRNTVNAKLCTSEWYPHCGYLPSPSLQTKSWDAEASILGSDSDLISIQNKSMT